MSKKSPPRARAPKGAGSRRETATAGRRMMRALLGAVATLAVVGMVALLGALWVYQGAGPAAKDGDKTTVVLRKGARLPEIASSLERGGVHASGGLNDDE